jgi:integrase
VYRYRRAVPDGARLILGRREIIKSLDTKDRDLAKARNHRVGAFVAEVLLAAKEEPGNELLKDLLDEFAGTAFDDWDASAFSRRLSRAIGRDTFDDDLIERYAEKWFDWLIASGRVEVEYIATEPGILFGPMTDRRAEMLFEEYLEATGLNGPLERDASGMKRFKAACLHVLDDHSEPVRRSDRRPQIATGSTRPKGRSDPVPLSKGMTLYKEAVGVRRSTGLDWDTAIGRLIAFMEEDCDVRHVTPDHMFDFRDRLLTYPSRPRKEHRDLSFGELCELSVHQPTIETLRPQTVNKNLAGISAMFEWLKRNRYMTHNPAEGVKAEGKKNLNRSRLPFDADDVRMIFGSGYPARSANADYWLPILAYFTGCRQEELAQLTVGAVKKHEGVTYLDIQGNVKNVSSVRPVPVHSRLVDLGFLDHVQSRGQPDRLLFDRLVLNKKGRLSDQFQKRFHRSLRDRGIVDSRKVFHSFRHLFVDFMRDSGIPIQVQNALTGHSGGGSNQTYGNGFSIPHLANQMDSIRLWHLPFEPQQ